jgi:hypothetical protein
MQFEKILGVSFWDLTAENEDSDMGGGSQF